MPKSLLGKYASGLLILFLLCLITVVIGIATGMTPRGSIQAIIIGISMLITGLATFITGLKFNQIQRSITSDNINNNLWNYCSAHYNRDGKRNAWLVTNAIIKKISNK